MQIVFELSLKQVFMQEGFGLTSYEVLFFYLLSCKDAPVGAF